VSTLPGPHGIGTMGSGARALVDFLAAAGFGHWQICPLGPTGFGDSPYQAFSSFAGNPYLIDLEDLQAHGLLSHADLAPLRALPGRYVDYGKLHRRFWTLLARAEERFLQRGTSGPWGGTDALAAFVGAEQAWLPSYAAFMALKDYFGGHPWRLWPATWRTWRPEIESYLPPAAAREAARHHFYQFLFFRQWAALRSYARDRGVALIGDVPIFVALDSADTWRWRSVFRLDADGRPPVVAGVPPDYFSARGQLWGNPLYDWAHLSRTGYAWWVARLRKVFELCDIVRIDHFRGLDTFWEIPLEATDATTGRWQPGPGLPFLTALQSALPNARLIAEDLGYVTAEVAALRRAAGLPGMKVLQFGYGHDDNHVNLPHFFPRESVVYTGTHDNDTTRGWLGSLSKPDYRQVASYFGLHGAKSAWPLIQTAFACVSRLAVVPIQDLLDLPSRARLNRPGTTEGNWQWRFSINDLGKLKRSHLKTLQQWHRQYDRTGDDRQREYSAPPT
jgi:4-alpha-glucanotransferase